MKYMKGHPGFCLLHCPFINVNEDRGEEVVKGQTQEKGGDRIRRWRLLASGLV